MKKTMKKSLSMLLAIVMLMTCFSVALPIVANAVASAAQWTELVNALSTTEVSSRVTSSTVTNDNGAVWRAAEALYNVAINEYSTANNSGINAATLLNARLQAELSTRMGPAFSTYNVAAVINRMVPITNVSDMNNKKTHTNTSSSSNNYHCQNLLHNDGTRFFPESASVHTSALTTTFKVTRTLESTLLSYDNASSIPDSVNLTKTLSFVHAGSHTHTSKKSSECCNDDYTCTGFHYFSSITRVDSVATATNKAALVNFNNQFTSSALATNLLTISDADLNTLVTNNTTCWNAISGFSAAVRTKFLTNYAAVPAFMQNCVDEQTARQYLPSVKYFQDATTGVIAVGYNNTDLQAMRTLQAAALVHYNKLNGANAATKAILTARGMDLPAIKVWVDQLEKDIQLCRLRQIKAAAEIGYNDTYADVENLSDTLLQLGIGEFQGYVNELNAMDGANVNEVFGVNGAQYIYTHLAAMKYEAYKRDIELTFANYVTYFEGLNALNYAKTSSDDIIAAIDDALVEQAAYIAFYNAALPNLTGEDAEEIFNGYNAKIVEYIDNAFKVIEARFAAQVQLGVDLYNEVGRLDWTNFTTVKAAIGQIETAVYDRLISTSYMSAQTRADYLWLLGLVLTEYNNFINNPPYVTTTLDLPVREVRSNDFARPDTAEGTYDYKVTDDKLNGVMTKLDSFITGDTAAELLGLEGGIGSIVRGLISDGLFTDEMVNKIMGFLPSIAEALPDVLKELPQEQSGAELKPDPHGLTLYRLAGDLGFAVFPGLVAPYISNTTNKNLLDSAGMMPYDDTWEPGTKHYLPNQAALGAKTNWFEPAFYDAEEDEFTFVWGIDAITVDTLSPSKYPNLASMTAEEKELAVFNEKKELFLSTAAEILKGLERVLQLLLFNRSFSPKVDSLIYASIDILITDLTAHVAATFNFSGANLFNDILVPIFSMLGLNVSAPAQTATTRQILDAIFNPLLGLIDEIATKPIQTLTRILPNLSYYMVMDKISPLINNISDISIALELSGASCGNGIQGVLVGIINALVNLDFVIPLTEALADLDLATMVNEYLGDLNNLLGVVLGELADAEDDAPPIALPILNTGLVATLGTLSGGNVTANKPQVFLYLLQYIFKAIQNEEFIAVIMDLLAGLSEDDEEPVEPVEPGEDEEDDDLIGTILGLLDPDMDIDDAIAALVEFFYPVDYPMNEYTWVEPEVRNFEYLKYKNNWTKEKAIAVGGDFEGLVAKITDIAGIDLQEEINGLLADVFTADTLISLAETLADLGLDEDITTLLKDLIGIDLTAWSNIDIESYNPVVESSDDFFNELCNLLAPAAPLVALLLGDKDIVALDMIVLQGYDGYGYGLLPIFEALGLTAADGLMTPAQYKAAIAGDTTGTATINGIIDPIKLLINKLIANPVGTLEKILPSLLYFLETDGLATALSNILQSVFVLLDTVRPIVDLDLQSILELVLPLIAGEAEEGEEPNPLLTYIEGTLLTIDSITLGWIFGLIYEMTGLNLSRIVGNAMTEMAYISKPYTSLNGGSYYTSALTTPDLITILISVVIELLYDDENRAAVAELMNDEDGILAAIIAVITDKAVGVDVINWFYFDPSIDPDDPFATWDGVTLPQHTIDYITYPNNWNAETAAYLDENLDAIVNMVMGLIDPDGGSIADLLAGSLDIYNDETIESIIGLVTSLTEDLDIAILELVGAVLDVNLAAYSTMTWPTVTDKDSFIAALAIVLEPVEILLDWILFEKDMKFFHGTEVGTGLENLITINGSKGYEYGLVPILEALGIENLKSYDELTAEGVTLEDKLAAIVGPVLTRLDGILADPLNEILALIPNLVYFMNADGLTVSVNNLLGGVYNILDAIEPIAEVDLDETLGFPLSDLSLANILDVVSEETGINLDIVKNFLTQNGGLYIGQIAEYDSVSLDPAFKMTYSGEESRKDMITILFTLVFLTLDDDNNIDAFKDMLGEDVFAVIKNILNLDTLRFDMQEIDWLYNVGDVKSAIALSDQFEYGYYRMWTREKAEYVYDNFDTFLNNLVYLLGIEIEGFSIENIEDLLTSLVGTTIYTADNANSIAKTIKDLIANIDGIEGAEHIKELVKLSLGIDLNAWNAYNDNSFTFEPGDRTAFVAAINELIAPLTPILGWLLTSDNFAFFTDEDAKNYVVLEGAEGYAYGIIPLLEAFGCERDSILTPAQFAADKDNMITNILNPLLDKLDTVLADPLNGIFDLLPGLIYFINSNGLDASFKNLLHPIYVVLNAIEPMVKVDLYEIIGLDLGDMNFDTLIAMLLESIEESTGYALSPILMDSLAELTVGKVVEFQSKNGKMARTMEYASQADTVDMVTILLRLVLKFVLMDENLDKVKAIFKEDLNMNDTSYKYVSSLLDLFAGFAKSKYGMDSILGTLYYVAFGVYIATGETRDSYDDLNKSWSTIFSVLESIEMFSPYYDALVELLNKYFGGIIDPDKVAPNGFIAFFQRIGEFFQKIIDFFKGLFGG